MTRAAHSVWPTPSGGRVKGEARPGEVTAAREARLLCSYSRCSGCVFSGWHQLLPFCQQNIPDGLVSIKSPGRIPEFRFWGKGREEIGKRDCLKGLFFSLPKSGTK